MIYRDTYNSPLGEIALYGDGENLIELRTLFWSASKDERAKISCQGSLPCLQQTKQWLDIYFAGQIPDFLPPIKLFGTAFQKNVWEILLTIDYGCLMTYGDIAKKLSAQSGKKMSAQAVGQAVGANPVGIIVPCHRVVGQNKQFTGYGGGLVYKKELLKLEGIDVSEFTMPKQSRFF